MERVPRRHPQAVTAVAPEAEQAAPEAEQAAPEAEQAGARVRVADPEVLGPRSVRRVLVSCVVGAGIAVAQMNASSAQRLGAVTQTARNLTDLRASLAALNTILVDLAQTVTLVQRQQLLAEGSQLIDTDLASINALGEPCTQGSSGVPPATSYENGPAPQGTPVPPSLGTPFPFSGGAAPMP